MSPPLTPSCQSFAQEAPLLLEDLSQQCWTGPHLAVAAAVGLPGLLVVALGLPLGVWLVLREKAPFLANESVKRTFGFLYNGFAPRSYYWEVLSLLRKEAVAVVSVFLIPQGTLVQALLLLLLLVAFFLLSARVRPYERPLLNSLERTSLAALALSAFVGLFFLAARSPASPHFLHGQDCTPLPHSSRPRRLHQVAPLPRHPRRQPLLLPSPRVGCLLRHSRLSPCPLSPLLPLLLPLRRSLPPPS